MKHPFSRRVAASFSLSTLVLGVAPISAYAVLPGGNVVAIQPLNSGYDQPFAASCDLDWSAKNIYEPRIIADSKYLPEELIVRNPLSEEALPRYSGDVKAIIGLIPEAGSSAPRPHPVRSQEMFNLDGAIGYDDWGKPVLNYYLYVSSRNAWEDGAELQVDLPKNVAGSWGVNVLEQNDEGTQFFDPSTALGAFQDYENVPGYDQFPVYSNYLTQDKVLSYTETDTSVKVKLASSQNSTSQFVLKFTARLDEANEEVLYGTRYEASATFDGKLANCECGPDTTRQRLVSPAVPPQPAVYEDRIIPGTPGTPAREAVTRRLQVSPARSEVNPTVGVFQVDAYRPKTTAQARTVASLDDDNKLKYREDRALWGNSTYEFVTITAKDVAKYGTLDKAINAKTKKVPDLTGRTKSVRKGQTIVQAWRLGNGATPRAAWGPKKNVNQTFYGALDLKSIRRSYSPAQTATYKTVVVSPYVPAVPGTPDRVERVLVKAEVPGKDAVYETVTVKGFCGVKYTPGAS